MSESNNTEKYKKLSKVSYIIISEEFQGQRIDNYLKTYIKNILNSKIKKNSIYKLIRTGQIRVNKKKVKVSYKLQAKNEVRIPPLSSAIFLPKKDSTEVIKTKNTHDSNKQNLNWLKQCIIYENKDLIVFDKPSGLAVHGIIGVNFGLLDFAKTIYKKDKKLELAHRLDKPTSGCLLVARTLSFLRQIQRKFRDNQVEKIYVAICHNHFPKEIKKINLPLARLENVNNNKSKKGLDRSSKPKKVIVSHKHPNAKNAITKIIINKHYIVGKCKYSILKLQLVTGRTHQIRVHLQHFKCPILKDEKYGNKSMDKLLLNNLQDKFTKPQLKRIKNSMALHCQKIGFKFKDQNFIFISDKILLPNCELN